MIAHSAGLLLVGVMAKPEPFGEPDRGAPPRARRYVDGRGVAWYVPERVVGNRAAALYFESSMAFRRVTEYPPDWWNLATDELEIVSLRS